MTHTTQQEMERRAEFTLPLACVACGGDLAVRVTPGRAFAYCSKCHWLSKPHVEIVAEGLRVGPMVQELV